jgi:SNO glutamine amidotransferase family/Acyl-CoA thioesterase
MTCRAERDPLPDDPVLHICALAYMSDLTLLGSVNVTHLDEREHLQVASLDHAMWFMHLRRDDLLASEILDAGATGRQAVPLGAIDITVRRHAFGRQFDSFEGDVRFSGFDEPVRGVFIRSPWVERCGAGVQVLARAAGHAVAVRHGGVLATAFHPEMTGDRRIHRLFVGMVAGEA